MSKTNTTRSRAQIARRRKIQRRVKVRALRAALAKNQPETPKAS